MLGRRRHFIQPWRKVLVQVCPGRQLALVAGLESGVPLRYRQLESRREMIRRGDGGQMVPAALAALLVSGSPTDGASWQGCDAGEAAPSTDETP